MATSHPVCVPFSPTIETVAEFVERFQVHCREVLHKTRNDPLRQASVLIQALPVQVVTDLQRRIKPVLLSEISYDDLLEKLLAQFAVKKSQVGASVKFLSRKQGPDESIEDYAKAINDLASECEYSDCCRDRLLHDAFVAGLHSSTVLTAVLQSCNKKGFNDCVEHAKLVHQIRHDASTIIQGDRSIFEPVFRVTNSGAAVPADYICIRCSSKGKHFAHNCFALQLTCNVCHKIGHIGIACRGGGRSRRVGNSAQVPFRPVTSSTRTHLLDESSSHSPEAVMSSSHASSPYQSQTRSPFRQWDTSASSHSSAPASPSVAPVPDTRVYPASHVVANNAVVCTSNIDSDDAFLG